MQRQPTAASARADGDGARVTLRTLHHADFSVELLVAAKEAQGATTSVVLPARDEEATVAEVVAAYEPLRDRGLVDQLLVVDSWSTDRTAARARAAGADVVHVGEVFPEVEAGPGKGEAMWRGLGATTGDLVAFCDADVLDAGPHFVAGLLGPMLEHPAVQLVKGFYERPLVDGTGQVEEHGGRVTELAARPFLNLCRPELGQLVQPLAGEWSGRRHLLESLPFPTGYGVEIGVLLDAHSAVGLDGLAQVDLGCRTHGRQSQQALGVMAAEVLGTALRRVGVVPEGDLMRQYRPTDHALIETAVPLVERPPVRSLRP
jgi:glucosyl-3-phosphoglycerate synthase